jgi:hypothetical protein
VCTATVNTRPSLYTRKFDPVIYSFVFFVTAYFCLIGHLQKNFINVKKLLLVFTFMYIPNFPAYETHRPTRHTVIFSLKLLEKNGDECILILVMYWKITGLLHILLEESKPFTSSDARSHDLEADFTTSQ